VAQKYSDPSRVSGQSTDDEAYEASPQQNGGFPGRSDSAQTGALGFEPSSERPSRERPSNERPSSERPSSERPNSERIASQSAGNRPLVRDPESLRQRWESIQVGFVDSPREAVGEAENLVSSAIGEIANSFRQQRDGLETSWAQGQEPSTDDLRMAFQNYRDFFGRLLQV
jgi:hypothetical protein